MAVGTLTVPAGTFHLSGNPIRVNITGATIPSGATDYKILCKVASVDGLLIGAPFIDAKTPVTGAASFDVSGYVDQPVDKSFDWPMLGGLGPNSIYTLDVNFTPGERYIDSNGDLQEAWGTASLTNFVIKGGVSFTQLGIYYDESDSFYNDFVVGGKFLTWMPLSQVVHPYQPVKLWLLSDENQSVELNIYAHYEDGDGHLYRSNHDLYINILHEINCLPFHADSLQMPPVKNGSKMDYYEVWIGSVTETRRFIVDHNYHENCNYLFVANSLGGIDCIWLNGAVDKGFKVSQVFANKPWPAAGTRKTRTKVVSNKTGSRTWRINTGYKSTEEMAGMPDLLLSKQVWLLEDASAYNTGTLYPVIITNSDALLNNSMEDLHSLELEIEEAHDNSYF